MSATSALAEQAAGLLAPRFGRRGFFARSAVVGSALAINPLGYVLEPKSAYAAVCSCAGSSCDCGSLCCDGYTEFCCTTTGSNSCPPGTLLGGWWKVDGTEFCGGPRYYMDCNAPCNGCGCGGSGICGGECSGTGCRCAGGSCDNRKAGCTLFRYGQCNQHVACLGPIVCRVVTCVPPWALDPSCTGTVRVDNATAGHDRACLHAVAGYVDSAGELRVGARVTGWALDFDEVEPVGVHVYVDGQLRAQSVADAPRPDVGAAYPGWGGAHGFDVVVPLAAGSTYEVCVYGINSGHGSTNPLLGCRHVTVTGSGGFVDVAAGDPFADEIGWLAGSGIANGFDDGTFRPLATVTRQAAAAFLWRLLAEAGGHPSAGQGGFTDVGPDHPFAAEIGWMASSGVSEGYEDGTFQPMAPVSRQAMAAFLARLFVVMGGDPEPTGPGAFSDVPPSHGFASEIGWLAASEITTGFDDGTFRPGLPVSRQATAAFLNRFWELAT